MSESVFFSELDSPLGPLLLTSDGEALTGVFMAEHKRGPRVAPSWTRSDAPFAEARRQLEEYFAGRRRHFVLALAPRGTPFQQRVWEALAAIPFGTTRTYQALAHAIGVPTAARAVGAANGRNPLSIIVPCHRVVGADGSLTGYAGGEERKRWLLSFEGCLPHAARQGALPLDARPSPSPAGRGPG